MTENVTKGVEQARLCVQFAQPLMAPCKRMHQHSSILKLSLCLLLHFTSLLTSIVFTNVTIGMGDDIHNEKALLLLVF